MVSDWSITLRCLFSRIFNMSATSSFKTALSLHEPCKIGFPGLTASRPAHRRIYSHVLLERHPTRNSIRTAFLLSCSSALRLRTAAPRPTCSTPPPRTRRRTAAGGAPDALYGFTAFEDDGFSAMSWGRASRLTPDTHACLSAQAAPVASRLPGSWPSHRVTVGRVKIDAGYGRYPTFTRHEQLACDAVSAWKPGAQGLEQTRPANGKPLGLIWSGNLRLTADLNN